MEGLIWFLKLEVFPPPSCLGLVTSSALQSQTLLHILFSFFFQARPAHNHIASKGAARFLRCTSFTAHEQSGLGMVTHEQNLCFSCRACRRLHQHILSFIFKCPLCGAEFLEYEQSMQHGTLSFDKGTRAATLKLVTDSMLDCGLQHPLIVTTHRLRANR